MTGPNLFTIIQEELERAAQTCDYNDSNVISYPMNMGITGKSIGLKKVVIANKGEMDPTFAPEVDNFSSVGKIYNMMVGPMLD
mmetsp:Transcript_16688/g.25738  ORF Transcript_16688/g.25738 Transcript_16688/m.25738 type:complete len:83 (-) Transcript_16688:569-817(-)